MDINIEEFYKTWKRKKLLDRNGALVVYDGLAWTMTSLSGIIAFLVLIFSTGSGPITGLIALVLLIAYLFFGKSFVVYKIFQDRIVEVRKLFFRKEYAFSDIVAIRKGRTYARSYYSNRSREVDACFVDMEDGSTFIIHERFKAYGEVEGFFRSAFNRLFWNDLVYEAVVKLSATMVALKSDESYRKAAQTFATQFITDSDKVSNRVYRSISNYVSQIDKKKFGTNSMDICLSILKVKGVTYHDRLRFLSAMFGCAFADDDMVDDVELDRLGKIAFYLVIKDWDFNSLKYKYIGEKEEKARTNGQNGASQWKSSFESARAQRRAQACTQLGVSVDASLDEVKSAYREKVKLCHPDMLPADASAKDKEEASVLFRNLTEAYDFLCGELVVVKA